MRDHVSAQFYLHVKRGGGRRCDLLFRGSRKFFVRVIQQLKLNPTKSRNHIKNHATELVITFLCHKNNAVFQVNVMLIFDA